MNTKDEIIWNNIEALRNKKKLSYSALAEKMGVKPQAINSVKHSKRGIGKKSLDKFAKALGVSDKDLLIDIPTEPIKTQPAPTSDEIDTLKQVTRGLQAQCDMLLTGITSHDKIIHDLQARISSIEKRMTEYAASGDKAKLRQTG